MYNIFLNLSWSVANNRLESKKKERICRCGMQISSGHALHSELIPLLRNGLKMASDGFGLTPLSYLGVSRLIIFDL